MIYAKKCEIDGIRFDSELEGEYYRHLKERIANNEISNLSIHPSYVLQKSFINNHAKTHNALTYEPDFVFYDNIMGKTRYIDTKGFLTDDFMIKWKLFDFYLTSHGPNEYLEVLKYSKATGWVEYEKYKKVLAEKRKEKTRVKNDAIHAAEVAKREAEKVKEKIKRYYELKRMEKRTSAQEKRFAQLKEELAGYIEEGD